MPAADPPRPASPEAPARIRRALAGLILLTIGGVYALGLHRHFAWDDLRRHLDGFQAHVQRHWPAALAVFFLVYSTVTALSLPTAAGLSLVAGVLFGRWLGTLV